MMDKKIIIILCAVLVAGLFLFALAFNSGLFIEQSFTKEHYVDFPQGYRPWRENYGEPGTVPLVVEYDMWYDLWYLELKIKDPTGQTISITHHPTHNHPDWQHPDNWFCSGPHFFDVEAYTTWNIFGTYEITELKLHAQFNPTQEWEILDTIDYNSPASRRSIEVKYKASVDIELDITQQQGFEIPPESDPPKFPVTYEVDDGEIIDINMMVKNTGATVVTCDYRFFVDMNQDGQFMGPPNSGDFQIGGGWKEIFVPNDVITDTIQFQVLSALSTNDEIWIGLEVYIYDDDIVEGGLTWSTQFYEIIVLYVEEMPPAPDAPEIGIDTTATIVTASSIGLLLAALYIFRKTIFGV